MSASVKKPLLWFIVRTAPQREFAVNDILAQAGFAVYTPFEKTPCRVNQFAKARRERRYFIKPALRGYVFVAVHDGDPQAFKALIILLFNRNFLRGLFGRDGRPYVLDQRHIDMLRQVYDRGYDKSRDGGKRKNVEDDHPIFQTDVRPGDMVMMKNPAICQLPIPVVSVHDSQVKILLRMLGGEREVFVEMAEIELLGTKG